MRAVLARLAREGWVGVIGAALLWVGLVGGLAVAQHQALANGGNDLGDYAQIVWTTAHGRPFYSSLIWETDNFLGHHFVPGLAALAPLYALWPDARLLLLVQAAALAAGALPLFAFARPRLGRDGARAVVGAWLLSPLLANVALFEFHEIALAVPLLLAAQAALLERRDHALALWLGLALLFKEEVALVALGMGLYALLVQRRGRMGAALTGAALGWALLLFGWLMPALSPADDSYLFLRRYGALGATPGEMARTALSRPDLLLPLLAAPAKRRFVAALLGPLALLPLLGAPALLALPTLAYLLLSDYELQVALWAHYSAPLLPPLFLATVVALQRLQQRGPRWRQAGLAALLGASLVGAWAIGPLPGARTFAAARFQPSAEHAAARALLARVPARAAVASEWRYYPFLANRWALYGVLTPHRPADGPPQPEFLALSAPGPGATFPPSYPWIAPEFPNLPAETLRVPRFAVAEQGGTLWLWQRRPAEADVSLARLDAPFERGLHLVGAGLPPEAPAWGATVRAAPGTRLPIWLAWAGRAPLGERITFALHLVDDAGRTIAQVDQEMGAGAFPTTRWHEWMREPVVLGEFPMTLPAELPPGRYQLRAGAYQSESVTPLLRPDGSAWLPLAVLEVAQ